MISIVVRPSPLCDVPVSLPNFYFLLIMGLSVDYDIVALSLCCVMP